jgi:osmotically-inducible protein OsmY
MKKILLIVLSIFCLSACVPVFLVAAGATAGGALVYDKRNVKTIATDRDVASNLLKQINEDPILKKETHIIVATFNRLMLVAGQAATEEQRNRVYQMASNAPYLKRIYNEITIEAPTSAAVQANDSWITTKAKSRMLAEKGLHSSQIKVVTENTVIYLMGIVTQKQADLAANVASTISGVSKVVRIFEYE